MLFSILIATYNGAKRLPKTLEHIAHLTKLDNYNIEVIIVDNASTDDTTNQVTNWLANNQFPYSCQIYQENKSGKTYALNLGVEKSNGEYILVCDDDNYLDSDYIKIAYNILNTNKNIGALGGKGIPVFQSSAPYWFKQYETTFAVGEQSSSNGDKTEVSDFFLWGAGAIFKADIWKYILQKEYKFFLSTRRGKISMDGEDSELCQLIRIAGLKIWYDNNLIFHHFMPSDRLHWHILEKRFRGFGRASLYMDAYIKSQTLTKVPGEHLKLPLWADTYLNLLKSNKFLILKGVKYLFSNSEGDSKRLKYEGTRGRISELWRIKSDYSEVYRKIIEFSKQLKEYNKNK